MSHLVYRGRVLRRPRTPVRTRWARPSARGPNPSALGRGDVRSIGPPRPSRQPGIVPVNFCTLPRSLATIPRRGVRWNGARRSSGCSPSRSRNSPGWPGPTATSSGTTGAGMTIPGTTPEQMEGWGWQSVHDPEVLPEVLERWAASIADGEPFEMVFPLRGADGRFRQFLTRVLPSRDAEGRVIAGSGRIPTSTSRSGPRRRSGRARDGSAS